MFDIVIFVKTKGMLLEALYQMFAHMHDVVLNLYDVFRQQNTKEDLSRMLVNKQNETPLTTVFDSIDKTKEIFLKISLLCFTDDSPTGTKQHEDEFFWVCLIYHRI